MSDSKIRLLWSNSLLNGKASSCTAHAKRPPIIDRGPFASCSPDGIRTRATALRGRRARPLHNGAKVFWLTSTTYASQKQRRDC